MRLSYMNPKSRNGCGWCLPSSIFRICCGLSPVCWSRCGSREPENLKNLNRMRIVFRLPSSVLLSVTDYNIVGVLVSCLPDWQRNCRKRLKAISIREKWLATTVSITKSQKPKHLQKSDFNKWLQIFPGAVFRKPETENNLLSSVWYYYCVFTADYE